MTVAYIITEITGSLQQNQLIKSNQTLLMICIVIISITTHQYGISMVFILVNVILVNTERPLM